MQIEGKNPALEAIKNNVTINRFMVQNNLYDKESNEIISLAKAQSLKIDFLPKDILDKKSITGKHQGFILETTEFVYSELDHVLELAKLKNEAPFILILDGIEDPHNFGAIIRSAECAGVHGVIIPEHRACSVNETVLRTSAGAASNMLIVKFNNLKNAIGKLKDAGLWIFAGEANGRDAYQTNLKGPIALIIGSEGNGISKTIKESADDIISLPMQGKVNSLNASVAAGILLFEIVRQRKI